MRRRAGLTEPEAISVLRVVAAIGAALFVAYTAADPDLWGHVRFGEDILRHGAIASHDPYSFTSDRTWVNHEWLAEVLMGLAYRAGGAIGLVVLKAALVVGALVLVSKALRRVAWSPIDHDLLVALAILATLTRAHLMRPQAFSVLLFAALLFALTAADRGNRRPLIVVPVVMLAWANLHGGWIVGLLVVSIWAFVRFVRRGDGAIERRWLALLWIGCVAATLVNPYGVGLWTFLRDTVGLSRPGIADWAPLFELPVLVIVPVAAMAATALVALAKARRGVDPAYVLIVVALGVLTVRVGRIDAFFGLAVIMLLGPYLGRARAAAWHVPASAGPALWRRPVAIAIAAVAVLALGGVAGAKVTCMEVIGEPEPETVAFLQRHAPAARVLTYFDWGEYAIWHLGPRLKVSMDGRRETVYSDALFQAHARLYRDEPGATALVARLHPDLIWLPVGLPVVRRLERAGWTPVFRGSISVILDHHPGAAPARTRPGKPPKRCFPDA
jgi:hypothetical protein